MPTEPRRLVSIPLLMPFLVAAWGLAGVHPARADSAKPAVPNTLTAQEIADGWLLLFDGETLFGWQTSQIAPVIEQGKKPTNAADLAKKQLPGLANWRVADGAVTAASGKPERLTTTSCFADYVLKLDFLAAADSKAAVVLRVPRDPRAPASSLANDEVPLAAADVADTNVADAPSGNREKRSDAEKTPRTEWQSLEITLAGKQLTIVRNGRKTVRTVDSDPAAPKIGRIGLRFETDKIAFRNLKLKPLGDQSMFDGRTLDGWRLHPEGVSRATVTPEGAIHLTGGKGQLESTGRYADFLLRLDVFVNGSSLNSGVFFRCIPGQLMNGYESQIHNGFRNGDRSQPVDCGTGGIFRRQIARKVVADDRQWFTKTILADGPHTAVWVNGYQVSDWVDRRPPHENPRNGLRTAPGTIIFQGHDPTTDLYFRNMRIIELPSSVQDGGPASR